MASIEVRMAAPMAVPRPVVTASSSVSRAPRSAVGGTAVDARSASSAGSGPPVSSPSVSSTTAGVRIETIGLGTPQGTVIEVDGFSIATALDAPTLQRIAETTGGTYHAANDAASLAQVYDSIQVQWVTRTVPREITSLFAGLAALLLLAGATVSVLRQEGVI